MPVVEAYRSGAAGFRDGSGWKEEPELMVAVVFAVGRV